MQSNSWKKLPQTGHAPSFPLSHGQQAMWYLYQTAPQSSAYNMHIAVRIGSELNLEAWHQAWQHIVERHPILRTTYTERDGQPVQVVHPYQEVDVKVTDASSWSDDHLKKQIQAETECAYNLETGPVLRVRLFTRSAEEHIQVLAMHHIAGDLWSFDILLDELRVLYPAKVKTLPQTSLQVVENSSISNSETNNIQVLPTLSYTDYVRWQTEMLASSKGEQLSAYWLKQLAGELPLLDLPVDKPRPRAQTYRGATHIISLDEEELLQKLRQLSETEGTSLYRILLAAFFVLLYRLSSQEEIVVGTPMAGRSGRKEFQGIVGYFVNSIVVSANLAENPTFKELLAQVSRTVSEAREYQDYPFPLLVKKLSPDRDASRHPLFQVSLNSKKHRWFSKAQKSPLEPEKTLLVMEPYLIEELKQGAAFDLNLAVVEAGSYFQLCWQYNTDLFDDSTVRRMAGSYQTLLKSILTNPEERVSALPLLTQAERHQLLVEWNNTEVDYPRNQCIHQLFEEQVQKTPHSVAVVYEDEQLTYQQLNERANQLAHYLQTLGVGSEVLVGICVERSLEMIVGLLGILKAGGAYLPLDPSYPAQRLAYMLKDAEVPVLLTQQSLLESLPEEQTTQVVCLDRNWQASASLSQENPVSGIEPENLAYVIYTSGSTGKPKGVMVSHQSICNHMFWMQRCFPLSNADKVLQKTPFSFDASIWEFYAPLLAGAQLIMAHPGGHQDSNYLLNIIAQQKITIVQLVPTLLRILLEQQDIQSCNSLKRVFCGGETLPVGLQQNFFACLDAELHNLYGPTEACIDSIFWTCQRNSNQQVVPIGRPIANTRIDILDRYLQPVPIGIPGELHIGGVALARGYLNRPDLTTEKFIPNPFNNEPGSRLYKTGDKARYLSDGNIEFLGRIDNQVKIRGFRIELSEIEAAIAQHQSVREVVVVVREDVPDRKYLAAYIVPKNSQAIKSSEIRSFLKEKLPDYMLPGAFVMLNTLPLTPNGKVDRQALPTPQITHQELEAAFVAPRTRSEELLTQIWREVLHQQQVGIDDNFFELGGDSILSILIIARAKQAGLQLTPKQIFEHQTIAKLVTVAISTVSVGAKQDLVSGSLPLTPIQHWFFAQNLPSPHHFNQAFLLEVQQELEPTKLQQAVQHLLVHHDALRLRFTQSDRGWQQINALPDEIVPLNFIDLSTLPPDQQVSAIESQASQLQASLNLESGPLLQVAVFHLGSTQRDRLLIVIHHLAVDGVSWRILLEDLQTAYQQLENGQPIELSAKTTSFQHWAEKLTEYAHTDAAKQELTYWQNISSTPRTYLPVDYQIGANTKASARKVSVSLNTQQTRALLTEVPKAYRTQINDVLLSALVQVLADWSRTSSVLIDLEGHGREEILPDVDLSRTVGWFTTIFPVLLQLEATENLGDLLKSVKEQLRGIPQRGIGYGLLRYLSGDAAISSTLEAVGDAEVSFNYLGQFDWGRQKNSLFKLASEAIGPKHHLEGHRPYLLEINSMVVEGQLQLDWTYSENCHATATIETLAGKYIEALTTIIAHCLSPEAFGYTPTDFPLAELEQKEIDQLLAQLSEISPDCLKEKIEDLYPLSPLQQGILFHSLYAPEDGVYFVQSIRKIQGNLNVEAFAQAWQQVVERYPILRTAFVWSSSERPLQVVYRPEKIPLEILDWRWQTAAKQQQQLEAFLASDRQQGFQLSIAPLMRLFLIQIEAEVYQFVWSSHHLLLDGWSVPPLIKEVFTFYEALCRGTEVQLKPVRHYREYIAWLRQQDLAKAQGFWQKTLTGFMAPTPLTVDRAATTQVNQQQRYSKHSRQLTVEATAQLKSFARQHQLTINTLVQGAWAMLLSRYSGEADVVFGVTVSGRSAAIAGVESLVGLLINTLPMRVMVSADDSVVPWLQKIQNQLQEINQYEYSPLVEIQKWSEVPRGLPLFESLVVFENYPDYGATWGENCNLHISDVYTLERTNYPLTVAAIPGTQLSLHLAYDCQRFDDATIARMARHFQTLLEALVQNPQQRVSQLPLLTQPEYHQLLVEWNNTTKEYPIDQCIHQLFEEQVERAPDAVAVVFETEHLTYQQLNAKANQLAHYLQSLEVGPEVLVGVCVERSPLMIIGFLGILKAGGVYLPIDPAYPPERIASMLFDSQPPVLLTNQKLVASLPQHQAQVVCLDTDWEEISEMRELPPSSGVTPENLAYVIYTSGSTGKPKGILMPHRGLCNFAVAQIKLFDVQPSSCVLQFASLSFDPSICEIVMALCAGAKLCLGTPEELQPGEPLLQLLQERLITHAMLVPSVLATLPFVELPALQNLIVMGEICPLNLVAKWSIGRRFFNAYGPSETICATVAQYQEGTGMLPSGRPIDNTQVYILDRYLQPVPIGVPGEVHIAGVQLGLGYLNNSNLTAEKFILNPFSNEPGSRLYKTGDKARYLSDGNIEYLGRLDNQVKVRGFRIELGEVEGAIASHPAVDQTTVTVREDIPDRKYLAAYIVPKNSKAIASSDLRGFLNKRLPSYMVPGAFVMLDALPLTPNGKVDRRALPTPQITYQELEAAFVAPRTWSEELLAQIWREVLHLELLSIHDNFFELGGDSILSIQIISRAKQAGLQLTPKQMFEHQTIAELADVAIVTQIGRAEQGLVTGSLPLTPIQHWFFKQNLPEAHHFNQAFLLSVPQTLEPKLLEQVVKQLLVHHDALRLRFVRSGSDWQLLNAAPDDTIPFSQVNLSTLPDAEQKAAVEAAAAELQVSLNLSSGPLVRVAFFALGTNKPSRLLIVIHHLVVDGVSWQILLEDLQTAYKQLSRGEAIVLPPKTTSFKDWAFKLIEYARSDAMKSELAYWLNLSHRQGVSIPVDYARGTNTFASARTVSLSLNVEETHALLHEVPKAYKTEINEVLLTALVQVLGKWTGNNSLLLDLEGDGREDIFEDVDLSRTIGWFTTIFPVLLQLEATDNPGDALKSVKEQLRGTLNRGIGYGLLRYLRGDAEITSQLSALPMAEVSFNYLEQFDWGVQENSLFKLATESVGSKHSNLGHRSHLLSINSIVVEGHLQLDWTYSENFHQRTTIESLARDFTSALRSLIAHCLSPNAGSYTPSDFPLAELDQQELDDLFTEIEKMES